MADNPLHRKLGLRPEVKGLVVAPLEEEENPLAPLPDGYVTVEQASEVAALEGTFAFICVFARDRASLAAAFPLLKEKLAPGGTLWVAWMRPAGERRGLTLPGDLNENVVRRLALTNALVDLKLTTLDRAWSALRLGHRRR